MISNVVYGGRLEVKRKANEKDDSCFGSGWKINLSPFYYEDSRTLLSQRWLS